MDWEEGGREKVCLLYTFLQGQGRQEQGSMSAMHLGPPPGSNQLWVKPQHPGNQNSGTAGFGTGPWADQRARGQQRQSCGALAFRVWPKVRALGALLTGAPPATPRTPS